MSISPAEIILNSRYAGCTQPDRTVIELRDDITQEGGVRVIYVGHFRENRERRRKRSCSIDMFADWASHEIETD